MRQLAEGAARSAAVEASQAEAVAEAKALLRLVEEGADEEVHELKQRCELVVHERTSTHSSMTGMSGSWRQSANRWLALGVKRPCCSAPWQPCSRRLPAMPTLCMG